MVNQCTSRYCARETCNAFHCADKLHSVYHVVFKVKERDYLLFLDMMYFFNQLSSLAKMLATRAFRPMEKEIVELFIENGVSILFSHLADGDMTRQLRANRDLHNEHLRRPATDTSLSLRPTFISESGDEIPYGGN